MIERLDGVTLQLAAREGSATAAIAKKVNELVDELNMLDSEDDKKVDGAETPPEKEDVTPEPSQQVQNVTQGKSGCNPREREYTQSDQEHANRYRPKKEETPIVTIEKLLESGIADYKKRLVERLKDGSFEDEHGDLIYLVTAIEIVKEVE